MHRRALLAAACGTCAVAVTGCATYGRPAPPAPVGGAAAPPPSIPGQAGVTAPPAALAAPIATTRDIPVDGGLILADQDVVVTQPTAGNFKAFSATCTHQGCVVTAVGQGEITCNCHGSVFSAVDGSVISGPAPTGLAERNITVANATITLA